MAENIVPEKHCRKCDTFKPITEFYNPQGRTCAACARAHMKQRRVRNTAEGKCATCGVILDPATGKNCLKCADKSRLNHHARYIKRKIENVCVECGHPVANRLVLCDAHAGLRNKANQKKAKKHTAQGLCAGCSRPRMKYSATRCESCHFKVCAHRSLKSKRFGQILKDKLEAQNYKCAYSGIDLILGKNTSVDHILPVSTYPDLRSDPDNVQWVTTDVNYMKNALSPDDFLKLVEAVYRHSVMPKLGNV